MGKGYPARRLEHIAGFSSGGCCGPSSPTLARRFVRCQRVAITRTRQRCLAQALLPAAPQKHGAGTDAMIPAGHRAATLPRVETARHLARRFGPQWADGAEAHPVYQGGPATDPLTASPKQAQAHTEPEPSSLLSGDWPSCQERRAGAWHRRRTNISNFAKRHARARICFRAPHSVRRSLIWATRGLRRRAASLQFSRFRWLA